MGGRGDAGDDLAMTLARWATRRAGLDPLRSIPIGEQLYATSVADDGGVPAIDVRDRRTGNERIYRVRFAKRGPRLMEYKRNAKGHWVWVTL